MSCRCHFPASLYCCASALLSASASSVVFVSSVTARQQLTHLTSLSLSRHNDSHTSVSLSASESVSGLFLCVVLAFGSASARRPPPSSSYTHTACLHSSHSLQTFTSRSLTNTHTSQDILCRLTSHSHLTHIQRTRRGTTLSSSAGPLGRLLSVRLVFVSIFCLRSGVI